MQGVCKIVQQLTEVIVGVIFVRCVVGMRVCSAPGDIVQLRMRCCQLRRQRHQHHAQHQDDQQRSEWRATQTCDKGHWGSLSTFAGLRAQ